MTITKKEILTSITTVRFFITILVCCVLMPASTWVLSSDFSVDVDDYNARVDLEARRDPQTKQFQLVASRPVPQLSSLFRGIQDTAVNTVTLKYYVGWNMPKTAGSQTITSALFPTIDLGFIVGVLLSALALMLSFDAISGEKSRATLKMILSNSISRSCIVLGKWLGLSIVILIPFIAGLLLSILVFLEVTGVQLAGGEVGALIIACVVAAIYLSLNVLIGVVISTFTKNPPVSLLISLGVWCLMIFILPQISNAIASEIVPTKTPQMVERDIRIVYNNMANEMMNKNIAITERVKREKGDISKTTFERLKGDFKLAEENRIDANNLEREYWLKIRHQEAVSGAISLVSPYSAVCQSLMSLASTGPETHWSFLRQSYDYGEQFFISLWNMAFEGKNWSDIFAVLPQFKFQAPSVEERINNALIPMASILLFVIVLAMLAVFRFNHYDVR